SSWSTCHKILHILMFITSFGEQNITYKCCSNFLIHLYPYLKGRGDLKIKLAEVNKGSNSHPQNQVISSIRYSEITSSNTRVINGSDTPNTAVLEKKSLWLRLLNILNLE
ncbi:hypothetical protein ABLT96_14850, partial [Acinetobacter lwoffii]